jgi:hypothetical protein
MNKRDQKTLLYLIDAYTVTVNDLWKLNNNISEVKDSEVIKQRTYSEEKLGIIMADIHKLLNPAPNYFSYINLLTSIGVFNCVLLAVRSTVTGDVLMAGLAALFPFLIYLVRVDR